MTRRHTPCLQCSRYVRVAAIVALGCALSKQAASDDGASVGIPRVRSDEPAIALLIQRGAASSPTFRSLLVTIGRTDGIVYIGRGKCQHSVHACLMGSLTVAGPHRILRVLIDLRRPERELISAIGHELWHAIEVLRDPGIRSSAEMFHFFDQIAPSDLERFETAEAIRAGDDVFKELGARK
jgi:hypothetical protein